MQAADLIRQGADTLRAVPIHNSRREAEWIFEHVSGRPAAAAVFGRDTHLTPGRARRFLALVCRRAAGEPLQYLLGTTEFCGLTFAVGPGVLVPRPETERLVELALRFYPGTGPVCDLGTGAGGIALALAAALPVSTRILGLDISPDALRYARRNRARHGRRNVRFSCSDMFGRVGARRRFALITANPPYVAPAAYRGLPRDVRDHEPKLALVAPQNGLGLVRRVVAESRSRLETGAWLLCEIGSDQADAVRRIGREYGAAACWIEKDAAGRDRVACICWHPGTDGSAG